MFALVEAHPNSDILFIYALASAALAIGLYRYYHSH
jgi:hypothetical protein